MEGLNPHRGLSKGLSEIFSAGFSNEPVAVLEDSERHREAAILVRLGDGEARARAARNELRRYLTELLAPHLQRVVAPAITTMPQRCDQVVEHTFVSFTRALAADLDIECINDDFVETRPRRDVTEVAHANRQDMLQDVWQFQGDLTGRTVILLDDVFNTGASLKAASQCLRRAGAEVIPLVLIRSDNEDGETKEILHKYFTDSWERLLDLPTVQGSLRRSIERWSSMQH